MIFTIKEGKHYSDKWAHKLLRAVNLSRKVEYLVNFDRRCLYTVDGVDRFDINKLFGFSIGLNHHGNSARFGWRSNGEEIIISAYVYREGVVETVVVGSVSPGERFKASIEVIGRKYRFTAVGPGQISSISEFNAGTCFYPGLSLWPYFGGSRTAPHDMSIELYRL